MVDVRGGRDPALGKGVNKRSTTEKHLVFTHILGHILENIGFEGHVDIDCPGYPAQFSLPHIQDPFNLFGLLATYHCPLPCYSSDLLDSRPNLGESQEVNVGKLLLILSSFFQGE